MFLKQIKLAKMKFISLNFGQCAPESHTGLLQHLTLPIKRSNHAQHTEIITEKITGTMSRLLFDQDKKIHILKTPSQASVSLNLRRNKRGHAFLLGKKIKLKTKICVFSHSNAFISHPLKKCFSFLFSFEEISFPRKVLFDFCKSLIPSFSDPGFCGFKHIPLFVVKKE